MPGTLYQQVPNSIPFTCKPPLSRGGPFTSHRRRDSQRHIVSAGIEILGHLDFESLSQAISHVLQNVDGAPAALPESATHMLTLGYEPIVLPCSSMNCGDAVYRSTLDPELRKEIRGINPQGIALLAAISSYLFAKPGVLKGFIDVYISAPLASLKNTPYSKEDFILGRKIATGGFGTVYKAELANPAGAPKNSKGRANTQVIVKKATEFGEAEVWMNERMMRAAPQFIAPFLAAFSDGEGKVGEPLWLAWQYEGDYTIADLMQKKEFPYNVEGILFDRALNIPQGPARKAVVIRAVMQQLLEALEACHANGIVHRDIKPQNCIFSEEDRRVKLIDFGAAADLRIGINYVPNQYLLDPRFAPPQQYVMSSQTPRAPPAPVAALLSPMLWLLNFPDRFDMWSVGVLLLQMALPPLRNDANIVAFNRSLAEQHNWDLNAWRRAQEKRSTKEWTEGFAILDALGGQGWDLLTKLIVYKPEDRLSASAALAHPWFDPSPLGAVTTTVESIGRLASVITEADDGWLGKQMAKAGTEEAGGFTEVELKEEFGIRKQNDVEEMRRRMQGTSATLAWWSQRQGEQAQRRKKMMSGTKPVGGGANNSNNGSGVPSAIMNSNAANNGGGVNNRANGVKPKVKKGGDVLAGMFDKFKGSK